MDEATRYRVLQQQRGLQLGWDLDTTFPLLSLA